MLGLKGNKQMLLDNFIREGTIKDPRIINAFKEVPRENFVLKEDKGDAYEDYPLPIPGNQTISQPTTTVIMTEALELEKGHNVLEIGTGSGYQSALISKIIGNKGRLISTEMLPELIKFARGNIKRIGIKNVMIVKAAENEIGYRKFAKYDRVIVTGALPSIPKELYDQLKDGGIIVAPVGSLHSQEMFKVRKLFENKYNVKRLGIFQFVPIHGRHGFSF